MIDRSVNWYSTTSMIYEYDIQQCDISVMAHLNIIDELEFNKYRSMDKKERVIKIGCLKRDNHKLDTAIRNEVASIMDNLIIANKLDEDSILEVAFDAIWVTKPLKKHSLSKGKYINIRNKREYNCILIINGVCYYLNTLTDNTLKRFETPIPSIDNIIFDCMRLSSQGYIEELYKKIHKERCDRSDDLDFLKLTNQLIDLLL